MKASKEDESITNFLCSFEIININSEIYLQWTIEVMYQMVSLSK